MQCSLKSGGGGGAGGKYTKLGSKETKGLKTVLFSTNPLDIFNDQDKRKQPVRLQATERHLECLKAASLLQEV